MPANARAQTNAGQNAALAKRNETKARTKRGKAAKSGGPGVNGKRNAIATPAAIAANGMTNGSRNRKPFSLI